MEWVNGQFYAQKNGININKSLRCSEYEPFLVVWNICYFSTRRCWDEAGIGWWTWQTHTNSLFFSQGWLNHQPDPSRSIVNCLYPFYLVDYLSITCWLMLAFHHYLLLYTIICWWFTHDLLVKVGFSIVFSPWEHQIHPGFHSFPALAARPLAWPPSSPAGQGELG